MADLESEIARLREELQTKERTIQEMDKNLQLAGKFGNELLDTNNNLDKRLESLTQETNRKIETLEQEKFSYKSKLETRAQMERSYDEEIENLKTALKREKQKMEDFINTEHQAEISGLKKQIRASNSDVEKAQLVEKQLKEKISELDNLLATAHEQYEQTKAKMNETCSDELAQLYSEVSSLQSENATLTSQLSDTKQLVERLEHDIRKKGSDLDAKDAEVEEKECLATSYFNALEKSREEVQELKVELDMIKMECQDQKKKGNSLFSEVEDRRVEAEKTLISMNIELESVKRQFKLSKENYHKLKMQMAGLLQMSCSRADTNAVQNLQGQLNQARSENTNLMVKINLTEQKLKAKSDEIQDLMTKLSAGSNNMDIAEYLRALLKMRENEIEKLEGEVKMERFKRLGEQDRVIYSEQKRYTLESSVEQLQAHNLKLSVKVEELQMKYEPDKCKKAKERKVNIEKLPVVEKKTTNKEEKENVEKRKETNYSLFDSDPSKPRLISESYYKSLNIGQEFDRKKTSVSKVAFSEDVNTRDISGSEDGETGGASSGVAAEGAGEPAGKQADGRVRGRQRHSNTVKVQKAGEDNCKTQ